MPTMTSLMRLERTRLKKLSIVSRDGGAAGDGFEEKAAVSIEIRSKKSREGANFLVTMALTLDWTEIEDSPFTEIKIKIDGQFSFPDETTVETIKTYHPVLCVANLLGVSRGLLANTTSLCASGPFILPLFNAHELLKQATAAKSEKRKKTSESSKGAALKKQ